MTVVADGMTVVADGMTVVAAETIAVVIAVADEALGPTCPQMDRPR